MAARAGLLVQDVEGHDLRRADRALGRVGPTGEGLAGAEGHPERRRKGPAATRGHRGRSRGEITPSASTPARAANGHVCIVATGCARATTYPVASPKAIWETTNHSQSTRAFRAGLMKPSTAQSPPLQSKGASTPPQSMWRLGSIGRITA